MAAQDPPADQELEDFIPKSSNNKKSPPRLLKCYCNDDIQCPREPASPKRLSGALVPSSSSISSENMGQYPKLASFIEKHQLVDEPARYCHTSSMCMTKRLQKYTGETLLRYYCDQSLPDSIKSDVIQYRDCRVDTLVESDRKLVMSTSSEFCCNSEDFCNVDLAPVRSTKDLTDIGSHIHAPAQHTQPFWKPINIVLGCLSITVFLLVIVLFVLYLYKKVG